ncbi:MAG TPA: tetratricopeptide repeat protein [Sphingomicrobium sp.]|jgi:cytochrome c-type biogenesis protein CcmH|nr:tetratricopeptide repeat protein [Sphingomicrobium sp.]
MGWIILLGLIAVSGAGLWLLGVRRGLLQAAGAALLFGAAGYAFQGRPDIPGAPAPGTTTASIIPLTEARHAFYGDFTGEESWLRISEALARTGKSEDAVNILTNAVHRYPRNPQLWVGLGNALVDHSHGLTPASEFAYRRAAELSPGYPGPPFFYGLALARSGDREGGVAVWKAILAKAPANASWRPLIDQGVAALSGPPSAATR